MYKPSVLRKSCAEPFLSCLRRFAFVSVTSGCLLRILRSPFPSHKQTRVVSRDYRHRRLMRLQVQKRRALFVRLITSAQLLGKAISIATNYKSLWKYLGWTY
jgi:hypothetical protein